MTATIVNMLKVASLKLKLNTRSAMLTAQTVTKLSNLKYPTTPKMTALLVHMTRVPSLKMKLATRPTMMTVPSLKLQLNPTRLTYKPAQPITANLQTQPVNQHFKPALCRLNQATIAAQPA